MTQRVGGYWLNWLRSQGPAGIALAHMLGETESMSDFCQVSQQVAEFASENICKWPDADVPWTLVKLLPDKTEAQMKALLQPAFSKWDHVKVRYVERSVDARVLVGCRHIDGQNGILADCYLPCGGVNQVRLQFDTGDHWDEEKFQQVAWHEFGHALGLGHAPQSSPNIMAPYLNMQQRSLGQWDRDEQAKRYPAAQPPSSPPTTGGLVMNFIWSIVMKLAKDWLDKAIADGTLQRWLEELLKRFANGQIKNTEDLGSQAAEALKVVAP